MKGDERKLNALGFRPHQWTYPNTSIQVFVLQPFDGLCLLQQ